MKPPSINRIRPSLITRAAFLLAVCATAVAQQSDQAGRSTPPSDAEAREVLARTGLDDKPVCLLSTVSFPYAPSGFDLFSPNLAIADRLAKLGLLVRYGDAGSPQVRFELTDAGRRALNPGNGAAERGFCAGRLRVQNVRSVGIWTVHGLDDGYRVDFELRGEPGAKSQWVRQPETASLFPELEMFQSSRPTQLEAIVKRNSRGWYLVTPPRKAMPSRQ